MDGLTMQSIWLAVGFAVFMWWFSTGLVLLLDSMPRRTFRWSLLTSTLLTIAALAALHRTSQQTSLAGAYCAFTCALLIWGWHELTFLTGAITGPRRHALPAHVTGWPRFAASVQAILWHELAILAMGALIVTLTWGAPNQVGTTTFIVLWVMRISAKLNLYFGVRNLSEEFLPAHLAYLASFFRRRRMNALLPFSVLGASVVAGTLISAAGAHAAVPAAAVGSALVATLLVLAIVEHLLLVLPIPATALWRWAMRPTELTPSPAGGRGLG
jgi:putative photosynthetic complex assembly protein 2